MLAFLLGPFGRWALIGLAFVGIGGAGFLKGMEWAEGKQAKQEVKEITKTVEVIKKVQVGQDKIAAAYEKGRAEREEEFRKLQNEFEQQLRATLAALPAACTWSDDVVGLLNRARQAGRPATGSGKPASTVPPARSAYRWETGIGGEADAGRREDVPRL